MRAKTITFSATEHDLLALEYLKNKEMRRSYSDMIRFLIHEKYQKILSHNVDIPTFANHQNTNQQEDTLASN